jgi:hypothetical protein
MAVCVPDWLALVVVIAMAGTAGTEAIIRLVELRRGRNRR